MILKKLLIVLTLLNLIVMTGCTGSNTPSETADMLLINCNIAAMTDSITSGNAIAVKGDTIWKIGFIENLQQYKSDSTIVIDAKNNFVMPGLIDSHLHLLGVGFSKINLDLSEAKNWDEVVLMVVNAAADAGIGKWIIGHGWHQDKWDPKPLDNVNGYPVHTMLSEAVPGNPVILSHASGHAVVANKKAMDLAGITDSTANPEGGIILRDTDGHATGVFEETAAEVIWVPYIAKQEKRSAIQVKEDNKKALKLAFDELAKYGITSIHDAGSTFDEIALYSDMAKEDQLTARLNIMIYETNKNIRAEISNYSGADFNNKFLRVKSVKKYIDGALGSRGAWLFEPYSDLPDYTGLNVTPLDELRETAKICLKNGLQLCTHAIGTRGNSEILDIYQNAVKKLENPALLRWRVEHAQHVLPTDVKRYANLGIIAAMQGKHCTSDAIFVIDRLGKERAKETSYIWRDMINAGVVVCNGTDAPVEKVDPFASLYSSITRRLDNGDYFFSEQAMTREEALKSYTVNGAYASFEESIKGTLEVGKLADIVILDTDILTAPEAEIKTAKVLFTILGGKVIYTLGED